MNMGDHRLGASTPLGRTWLVSRHPLRGYDAPQLAGCLTLKATSSGAPIFVCASRRLLAAAEAEGLTGLDPEG